MRFSYTRYVGVLAAIGLALSACSDPPPPAGRWQGVYEDTGVMIVARLEIRPNGAIRVSAPNAITDAPLSAEERGELKQRLEDGLARSWPEVDPLRLEFDGKAFRKPGGIAPQLEWDPVKKQMTLIYYSGNRSSVRVPLAAVGEFGS